MESIKKVTSDAVSNMPSEEATEFDKLSSDEQSSGTEANPVKQPKTYDEQVALIKSKGFIVKMLGSKGVLFKFNSSI